MYYPGNKRCDESHSETEKVTFYFNEYAVVITRCKKCKEELNRHLYRKEPHESLDKVFDM